MGLLEIEADHLGRKLLHHGIDPGPVADLELEVVFGNSTWNIGSGEIRCLYPQKARSLHLTLESGLSLALPCVAA